MTAVTEAGPVEPPPFVPGALVGGPAGKHYRAGWWTPLAALALVTIAACLVGYAQKFPCRDVGNWRNNYQYTRACYSDIPPLYSAERLNEGKRPYLDHAVEYPVLIGAAMQAAATTARLASAKDPVARNALFFDATAVLLTIAALVTVICTALAAGRRRWDAMLLAAAPLLAFHAFTNWDLLAVAFTAGAVLAWAKRAPAVAGLLLGFGAATKAYPLLVLVALGLLAYRAGRLRAWRRCAGTALTTLVLTYAVVWPFASSYVADDGRRHNNLWRFVELNRTRPADWDSLGYVVQYLARTFSTVWVVLVAIPVGLLLIALVGLWWRSAKALTACAVVVIAVVAALAGAVSYAKGHPVIPSPTLNAAGLVVGVLLLAGIAYVVLTAPRRPRLAQVGYLVLAAALVANKVDSPQYALWLLPFAVLAYPRWRVLLGWQLIEIFEVVMRYLFFVNQDSSAPGKTGVGEGWFVSAVGLRQAAVIALAVLIVREIYAPALDPVRQGGADDPAGGVLDDAPDRHAFV